MTTPALVVTSTTPQTGSAQTLAVNVPASIVTGNYLVAVLSHGGTMGAMPGTTPWTQKIQGSNNIAVAYIKTADHITNGSPSSYTFTTTSALNTITNAQVFQISGSVASGDPFDFTPNTAATSGSTSSGACSGTTTVNDILLISVDMKNASRVLNANPSGMTTISGGTAFTHSFQSTQAVAGATGTKTSTYTVGANHSSVLLAIKPLPVTQYTQSLTAVMDGNPFLTKRVSKFLTAVMDGNPFLTRQTSDKRTLTAVMDGTPTVARRVSKTLTAVMNGTGTIIRRTGKMLVAVMDGTPSVLRRVTHTLTTVMNGAPTLVRGLTGHRVLFSVMDGTPTISKRLSLSKTLVAVMNGTGTVGTANTFGKVISAVMNGIPRGFLTFPWDSIPSDCPEDWHPNDGLKSISGDVFFHEPPNEGDPVDGATVILIRDSDGLRIDTTLTDAAGHYEFPRDTNDPYTYHVEVRYTNQQGLSEGGCVPS